MAMDSMTSSKRMLLIGGSGRTGKLVISELLQRGHKVTALVRKLEAMSTETAAGLMAITGTPMNQDDVRKAFVHSQPEVVIVTLSAPRAGDSPFAAVIAPPRLMADATANVVAVMKEFNSAKMVIMQAFGVGESWPNMHCVLRLLMKKSNMIYQYDDHNLVAKETKASGEKYVFVRPSRLVEGDAQEIREWADHGKGVPMMAAITRGSVARFLVQAAESKTWDQTAPVITN
jgi:nucleoside-diphosphate-sugar epimerase